MKAITKKAIASVALVASLIPLSMVDSINGNLKGFIGLGIFALAVYLFGGFYWQGGEKK